MTDQLKTDHDNLKFLAKGLAQIKNIEINTEDFKTNILYFRLRNSSFSDTEFITKMKEYGIKFFALGLNKFRLVTHSGINKDDINYTLDIFNKLLIHI